MPGIQYITKQQVEKLVHDSIKNFNDFMTIGNGTTSHSLGVAGDLMISGKCEISGHLYTDGYIYANNGVTIYDSLDVIANYLRLRDNIELDLGTGQDSHLAYCTQDADAKMLQWGLDDGGADANNVPVLAILKRSNYPTNLGAGAVDFSAETQPTIALISADNAGYIAFSCGDDDIWNIKGTTSPVVEIDETKFSHKLEVAINGVSYYIMLTQT